MSFSAELSVLSLLYKLASSRKQGLFLVGGALRDRHLGRTGRGWVGALTGVIRSVDETATP